MDRGGDLELMLASSFTARARGLLWRPPLRPNQGMCLFPCRGVHTLGMCYPLDVVFLDNQHLECRRIDSLRVMRIAICLQAALVIELPAGYCQYHGDYLNRIRAALHRMARVPGRQSESAIRPQGGSWRRKR